MVTVSNQKSKTSLLKKGALLIAAPLLVNTVWMLVFCNEIVAESDLSLQENHVRGLLADINKMTNEYYESTETTMMQAITSREVWGQLAEKHIGAFHQSYSKVIRDASLLPEQKKFLELTDQTLQDDLRLAHKSDDLVSKVDTYLESRRNLKRFNQRTQRSVTPFGALFAPQEQELNRTEEARTQSRQRLISTACAGLLLNVLTTLILLIYFLRTFKTRLQMLVLHAEQLGHRSKIEQVVSGNDELSIVDQAIRESAAQLDGVFAFKRQLTEMMAHDLRSPLTSALTSVETMLHHSDLQERDTMRLNSIQSSILRLSSLVDDLLILDSLETGQMTVKKSPFNIDEVAKDCAEILQGSASAKGITVKVQTSSRQVNADQQRIEQVLTNLLSNAIKFSPRNSEILIEQHEEPGQLKLIVRDFGTGIKAAELEKVFDKYYRSENHKEIAGTGLGLAICKLIVEAHGGNIGVISNNGATFWFSIPNEL